MNRRNFLGQSALALLGGVGLSACGGGSSDGGVTSLPPSPSPSPVASPVAPPPAVNPVPPSASLPASAANRLFLWGASRTEGFGSIAPFTFPDYVAQLLPQVTVSGQGIAGQTTAQIVARQGGAPALLSIAGGSIPASGATVVSTASVDLFGRSGGGGPTSFAGQLGDVAGTYTADARFTRSVAGNVVNVGTSASFVSDIALSARDAVMFLVPGLTGITSDNPAVTVRLMQMAVDFLSAADRRYMIGGVMPSRTGTIGSAARQPYDRLNALLQATHSGNYLDLVTPPSPQELAATGYAPNAEDRADIAAGIFPRGLSFDDFHLNRIGQYVWALRVQAFYQAKGWA